MTRVLLGVDTEADNQWDAAAREHPTMANIAELPHLQDICDDFGVRPTYVVTYEVATDPPSRDVLAHLAATGRCEIGTHHHPWTTPPKVDGHLYPLNLTSDHYRGQLEELTKAVAEIGGQRPVSYRAGRNGFAAWQVALLEAEGYLVDSSVDPLFNERKKGGPSFGGAPLEPYFLSNEDARLVGSSKLLEVPVSSAVNRRWPPRLQKIYADFTPPYQFRRILRLLRIVKPVWLRPSYSKTDDMLRLAARLVASRAAVANIIFHSSELLPGGSPYCKTEEDVEDFYRSLRTLLAFLMNAGVEGRTFRELRDEWVTGVRP